MAVLTERGIERFMTGTVPLEYFGDRAKRAAGDMGLVGISDTPQLVRALIAIEAGAPPDQVARYLDWRDFEGFCARLMAAKGFRVTLDLRLKRPRAQVDILARSSSIALIVDCKHWAREKGPAGLSAAIEKQASRARLVRKAMGQVEPMAVVVLSLVEERPRYLGGGVVVPMRSLADFLDNAVAYAGGLTLY